MYILYNKIVVHYLIHNYIVALLTSVGPKARLFVTKEAPPHSCQAHCTKKSSLSTKWRQDINLHEKKLLINKVTPGYINCPLQRSAICDKKDEGWPMTRTRGTPPTTIPLKGGSRHPYTLKLSQKEKCGFAHGPLNIAGIEHSLTDWGFVRNIAAKMMKKNKGCLLPVVLLT